MFPLPARLLSILLLVASPLGSPASELRIGAARVDITPPNGTPMAGYFNFRGQAGVLDRIYAKTIVLEQDGQRVALVVLDLISTTRPIVAAARQLIAEQSGLPPERVMISATHTHTGPQLPRGTMMDEISQVNSPLGQAFSDGLPELIARSVREASAKLEPAQASVTVARAEGLSFNRRVLDAKGKLVWQPRKIDPSVDRPAGPVDPDLGLLVFEDREANRAPIAAYLNFAMHPTSIGGGTRISADYPGVFTRLLTERKDGEMIAVFANGCCGNLNHTNYLATTPQLSGPPETHRLGEALTEVALQAWPKLRPISIHTPLARSTVVTLERKKFTEEQIKQAEATAVRMQTEKLPTVPQAEAVCILETVKKKDVPLEAEVQVFALSDELAIVSLPGEIFVELGLAIKAASPFKHTLIAELANGSIGYVPNREAYPQGNYEVLSARGEAGSGEKLVETALNLLRELAAK